MKTPEEIKRGLLACTELVMPADVQHAVMVGALSRIRQLEEQNAELVKKIERLQRERDAAIADLSKTSDRCRYCKRNELYTAVCDECVHGRNFEWRGVPEPPEEEKRD